jgi:hypothetical protein
MKLAILGHSPLALEAALRFHLHGAAITWYRGSEDHSLFTSPVFPSGQYVTQLGLGVLKEIGQEYSPKAFEWGDWKQSYEKPIVQFLKAHQEVKDDEVISVTKRFLSPNEEIPGRSRFLDLFRIIHKVNPKDFIEEQKETNPETYQRLTEEFVSSLADTIEMYQDYDLVLDLRSDLGRASASVTGRALGEGRKSDKVFYSQEALTLAKQTTPNPDVREIALIGSDSLAAEVLLELIPWLQDERSRLFIVSHEEDPFKKFLEVGNPGTLQKLNEIFKKIDEEFEKEVEAFTTKLREWQELDDFVQVKIPRPAEPIPRLNFFSGHNVTAIDELIDKKRMFLTLEKPDFRKSEKHPENGRLDLKTIGVDRIFVAHGKKDSSLIQLDQNEAGFFAITPHRPNLEGGWEKDLAQLEGIEDEIFKLFSPADSH